MITRLSIPERAEIIRECRDRILEIHEEFYEILIRKFAPVDMRNYKGGCWAERDENGAYPYDDKDTPLIKGILTALDKAFTELDKRCGELDAEEAARYEAYEMFYAWELGLCPYVMREYRRKETPYAWNSLNWEKIAEFLKESTMSREDTQQAVSEYLKDKDPEGDKIAAVDRETWRLKTA